MNKNKKIAIIGRGTAGAITAAKMTIQKNVEVNWYYDPNIPTQAVGEGSNLTMPQFLFESLSFSHEDLKHLDGTYKSGIYKEGWGDFKKEFMHDFTPPALSYHFSAKKIQDFIQRKIEHKVKIHEGNYSIDNIDADYVIDCSGRPTSFDENEFEIPKYIPVDSVYVTQCYWDYPTFQYTLSIAKKYGWVFGIPLKNRCSIGYLYNSSINTVDEVKEDVKELFERYGLTPSSDTNAFTFKNYYRKNNFKTRSAYNGNASFFLEPLEATSFSVIHDVSSACASIISRGTRKEIVDSVLLENNKKYLESLNGIEQMIMMHYYSGSIYKSDFWEFAQERGTKCIENAIKNKKFHSLCSASLQLSNANETLNHPLSSTTYGTWTLFSYFQNIHGLNLNKKLSALL